MKSTTRLVAATLAASLSFAPVAHAQDELTPEADPSETTPSRAHAPNTDSCPNSLVPPEPTSTSEQLADGAPTPSPLPVAVPGDCGVTAPEGFAVSDDVLAASWLVADLDSGEIVAQKDPHGRYRPASVIKVLLALVVIEELDLQKEVTVSYDSAAQIGSAVGIGEGGRYTVEELLHGLLLVSGNDAAHALAQELGGDAQTLELINDKAVELGTTDTRAATYSGLDAPGMSSSAYDLGLIYNAAFADETFARIVGTESLPFPGYEGHEGYEVWNDNGLFMNDPDGIGGKTGFTDDANHTFVGALDRDGRRLVAILLDTTADESRPWEQAQKLLHEAYRQPEGAGVGTLEPVSTTSTITPTPAPVDTVEDRTQSSPGHSNSRELPVIGIAAVAAVLVALVIAAAMVLRGRGRR